MSRRLYHAPSELSARAQILWPSVSCWRLLLARLLRARLLHGPVLLASTLLALLACSESEPPPLSGAPGAYRPGETGFVDRTDFSGIDYRNRTGRDHDKAYIVEAKGGGSLTLDYDRDGWADLYAVDGNMYKLDPQGNVVSRTTNPEAGNRLYRNLGGWRFEDVTERAGVGDPAHGFGGGVGDYDNDGWPDIYVCNWGPNRLYHNLGDGTFEDVAVAAGVAGEDNLYSTCASFFDADLDGDLDLYVSNYNDIETFMRQTKGSGLCKNAFGFLVVSGPMGIPPIADRFYRNRGDGTFADDTETALPDQHPRYAFTSVIGDYDLDGDPDIYVANDMCRNTLWVNDGTGNFEDRSSETGVDVNLWGNKQAGMGNDSADYDQDGWPDLFVTNYMRDINSLYRNITGEVGTLFFEDVTTSSGLARGDFMKVCWCTKFQDFDLDGYLDVFVAAGHFYDVDTYRDLEGASYRECASLWLGTGPPDFRFRGATPEEKGEGLCIPKVGRGGCFADFDNDGDTDVYIAALNDRPLVLENRLPRRGAFLTIGLEGRKCHRDAIGTKVTVFAGGGRVRQLQEMRLSAGFIGTNDSRLNWGLGPVEKADRIEVVWPGGGRQEFLDVPANAFYHLAEGGELERVRPGGQARKR